MTARSLALPGLPAKGVATSIDGRSYLRIGDAGQRHAYSKIQPWSKDDRWLVLWYGGHWLFDGQTFAPVRQVAQPDRAQWSVDEANVMFGEAGSRIVRYDVTTGTTTTVKDFGRSISIGNGEGAISDTGVLPVMDGAGNAATFDTRTGTASAWFATGGSPDSVTVSRDGSKVIAVFEAPATGTGAGKGVWVWNRDGSSGHQIRTLGNHGAPAIDAAGRQVWVTVSPSVTSIDLATGQTTTLLASPNAFEAGHVGWAPSGWATLSAYSYQSRLGGDQDVLVKLDSSGTVRFFGLSMHRGSDYLQEPMAVANHAGTKALVAADWGTSTEYPIVQGMP